LPFIPGDLFKLVVAALLLPTAWMIVRSAHK
jgi:biotin transporter BioY